MIYELSPKLRPSRLPRFFWSRPEYQHPTRYYNAKTRHPSCGPRSCGRLFCGTPLRIMFRNAERRKSWNSKPGTPAFVNDNQSRSERISQWPTEFHHRGNRYRAKRQERMLPRQSFQRAVMGLVSERRRRCLQAWCAGFALVAHYEPATHTVSRKSRAFDGPELALVWIHILEIGSVPRLCRGQFESR
jgi:hypothetical protein